MAKYYDVGGIYYPDYIVRSFENALKTKGFVILAGPTGTGKTKLFESIGYKNEPNINKPNLIKDIENAIKKYKLDKLKDMNFDDWNKERALGGILNLIANMKENAYNPSLKEENDNKNFKKLYCMLYIAFEKYKQYKTYIYKNEDYDSANQNCYNLCRALSFINRFSTRFDRTKTEIQK